MFRVRSKANRRTPRPLSIWEPVDLGIDERVRPAVSVARVTLGCLAGPHVRQVGAPHLGRRKRAFLGWWIPDASPWSSALPQVRREAVPGCGVRHVP